MKTETIPGTCPQCGFGVYPFAKHECVKRIDSGNVVRVKWSFVGLIADRDIVISGTWQEPTQ